MRLAGLLHDVGKIGVPDAILNKPAKLTDDEYAVMKRHSLLGCDIVRAADMPLEARWVRHHHERFDGGGYPDGLAGDGIPLESRIILVADAFEAMTVRPSLPQRRPRPGLRARTTPVSADSGPASADKAWSDGLLCTGAKSELRDAVAAASNQPAVEHFLNFLPDPHQHGSLRPICSCSSTRRCCDGPAPPPRPRRRRRSRAPAPPEALGWSSGVPPEYVQRRPASAPPGRGAGAGRRPPPSISTSTLKIIRAKSDQIVFIRSVEEREGLVLVGDERIDLGEPAQVDALAQVVHVVEVLAPALVDDLQQQVALQRAHELLAELAPRARRRASARPRRAAR